MLSREVWGWRLLGVLLLALLIPTIPQLDSLEDEWRDSIDNSQFDEESQPLSEEGSSTEKDVESSTDDAEDGEVEGDEEAAPMVAAEPESSQPESERDESNTATLESAPGWILPATQIIVLTMMAIMAVGLLSSVTTALLTSEAARFTILLAIVGPIIAITQRGEGGIFTRGRILGFIEAHPGVHFSAIRDALQLSNGVTAHHLQILEKEGRTISWIDGKVRRFASSGVDQKRLKEIKSPVTGMQIAILQVLAEHGQLGIKSSELRVKLETSRQLLSYHMKQLTERDFVSSSGKGKATRWSLLEQGKKQLDNSSHLELISSD